MKDVIIVIPVYNEEGAIKSVLDDWRTQLDTLGIDWCICAYNDGSKDRTGEILEQYAAEYPDKIEAYNKSNSGHGPTILTGYRNNCKRAKWLFQTDSDNELPASSFRSLWEMREDYDFLLGRRDGRNQQLPRKIVSWTSRKLISTLYGKTVWDVNSPYRLMRTEVFSELFENVPEDTFAPNLIVSGFVGIRKLRFCQIDVPHQNRTTGEVSIKKWKLLKAAAKSFMQTALFALTSPLNKEKVNRNVLYLIKYCFIGCIGAGLDFLIYTLLTQYAGWYYLLANVLSVFVGIGTSFTLNAFLNFKKTDYILRRACSFFSVGLLGLLISSALLYLMIGLWGMSALWSKLITIVMVTIVQFLLNRLVTFKSQ